MARNPKRRRRKRKVPGRRGKSPRPGPLGLAELKSIARKELQRADKAGITDPISKIAFAGTIAAHALIDSFFSDARRPEERAMAQRQKNRAKKLMSLQWSALSLSTKAKKKQPVRRTAVIRCLRGILGELSVEIEQGKMTQAQAQKISEIEKRLTQEMAELEGQEPKEVVLSKRPMLLLEASMRLSGNLMENTIGRIRTVRCSEVMVELAVYLKNLL